MSTHELVKVREAGRGPKGLSARSGAWSSFQGPWETKEGAWSDVDVIECSLGPGAGGGGWLEARDAG